MRCERPVMWEHFEGQCDDQKQETLHGNFLASISSQGFHFSKLRLKSNTKTKQKSPCFSDTTGKLCVWTQSSYNNIYGKFKPEKTWQYREGRWSHPRLESYYYATEWSYYLMYTGRTTLTPWVKKQYGKLLLVWNWGIYLGRLGRYGEYYQNTMKIRCKIFIINKMYIYLKNFKIQKKK